MENNPQTQTTYTDVLRETQQAEFPLLSEVTAPFMNNPLTLMNAPAVNFVVLTAKAMVFCVASSCTLVPPLLIFGCNEPMVERTAYATNTSYRSFPLLDTVSRSSINAKRAATNLYGL